jgi:hypothetical protein
MALEFRQVHTEIEGAMEDRAVMFAGRDQHGGFAAVEEIVGIVRMQADGLGAGHQRQREHRG